MQLSLANGRSTRMCMMTLSRHGLLRLLEDADHAGR